MFPYRLNLCLACPLAGVLLVLSSPLAAQGEGEGLLHKEAIGPAWSLQDSVWGSDGGVAPKSGVRLPSGGAEVGVVDARLLAGLRIGMDPAAVVALAGEPLSRGRLGRWDYVARDRRGAFVVSLWFSDGSRLWMARSSGVAPTELAAVLAGASGR